MVWYIMGYDVVYHGTYMMGYGMYIMGDEVIGHGTIRDGTLYCILWYGK